MSASPLRIDTGRALIDATDSFIECADWYRRCLEDVVDRRPVRGLDEAQEGYHNARIRLFAALGEADPDTARWSDCGGGHAPLKPGDPPGCAYCPGATTPSGQEGQHGA